MTRIEMIAAGVAALTAMTAAVHAQAAGRETAKQKAAAAECTCDKLPVGKERTECEARVTNADGKDGKNNSGPNSGNGAAGGTITGAIPCTGGAISANGGNGGSNNKGANSGNGGKGGKISF
jgi:hypothetical protein